MSLHILLTHSAPSTLLTKTSRSVRNIPRNRYGLSAAWHKIPVTRRMPGIYRSCSLSLSTRKHSFPEKHNRRNLVSCNSKNGKQGIDGEAADQGDSDSSGDELEPLRDALEKAKERAGKSSFKREALEAEAQKIAEISLVTLERYTTSRRSLETSLEERRQIIAERSNLGSEIESLKSQVSTLKEAMSQLSKAEESQEQQQAETNGQPVQKPLRTKDSIQAEINVVVKLLDAAEKRFKELTNSIQPIEAKISKERDRVRECHSLAQQAEERVQAVMKAAQSAMTNELECQTVLKETQMAFENAMSEIDILESQELDAEEVERLKEESDDALAVDGSATTEISRDSAAEGDRAQMQGDERQFLSENVQRFLKENKIVIGICVVAFASILCLSIVPAGRKIIAQGSLFLRDLASRPAKLLAMVLPENYGHDARFIQTIWLLLMSVVMVPTVCRVLPGATPVLGFLAAGALVGPHALGIIKNVEEVRHMAELGVVFLLFNIGLELSLERLRSMAKMVFGMGSVQVLVTTVAVALVAGAMIGLPGPGAIILGSGLALSSTAVAMQVLQDRGETGSRHGRATFSILLLQDLAVVVVLMLIPLLSPKNSSSSGGLSVIFKALGVAAIKAVICITGIICCGRVLLRPIYNLVARLENKEIFAALTLLVVFGTSEITQLAGLSLALGAFLAGLLLAETEYVVQVESDIEPYKGLLMGLFFMTVGMEISVSAMVASWRSLMVQLGFLLTGKVAVMAAIGPLFGISRLTALRSGLMLAPGGEFAFVAFGEAAAGGILPVDMVTQLYLVVSLSMAVLPYLAIGGAKLGKMFESGDMKAMQPNEVETGHLKDHVIIAGFGRVGQLISRLLSERLIPFVAVDVVSQRVQHGKSLDLPVYFGDAGSQQVLHSLGASKASCVVVVLDSPGSNYRTVWTIKRYFPNVKTYVRAFDMDHARNLERIGANVVIPETLEPSLQLAAQVLAQVRMPEEEIGNILDEFRRDHFAELQSLSQESGYSLGYGYSQKAGKNQEKVVASIDESDGDGTARKEKPPGFGGIIATP